MNENRTEKIAKIILTIIIFGFIMVQFIANIVTLKGACSGEVKKVNAATESITYFNIYPLGLYKEDTQDSFYYSWAKPIIFAYNNDTNRLSIANANLKISRVGEKRPQFWTEDQTYFYCTEDTAEPVAGFMFTAQNDQTRWNSTTKDWSFVYQDGSTTDKINSKPTYINITTNSAANWSLTIYFENGANYTIGIFEFRLYYNNQPIDIQDLNTVYSTNSLPLTTGTSLESYNNGYRDGTKKLEQYGQQQYNAGKADGIASANEYTFQRLISAVFDVPVQTIYGLFNFEILGVNILNFVLALATLAIVLAIVKAVI